MEYDYPSLTHPQDRETHQEKRIEKKDIEEQEGKYWEISKIENVGDTRNDESITSRIVKQRTDNRDMLHLKKKQGAQYPTLRNLTDSRKTEDKWSNFNTNF